MIVETGELAGQVGVRTACWTMGIPRSSYYRTRRIGRMRPVRASEKSRSVRALSPQEKHIVRQELNSERFMDLSPRAVYASLLDEGRYLCHWRSMYRVLAENDEVRERRPQRRHPGYTRPELVANGPNQLWSWDITKLLGPAKWVYYYLYVVLDVFSRFVVGWMLAEQESGQLAEQLIAESCAKQHIQAAELTLHADRGAAMTSKNISQLLVDLGVDQSHSRPHTPDDNPYSEAQFKTLKYRPDFPGWFEDPPQARGWARSFFQWYNHDHHHSGIALLTPANVHYGQAQDVLEQRQQVLWQAYQRHPERFVGGAPQVAQLPSAVWINPPKEMKPAAAAANGEAVGKPEQREGLSTNPRFPPIVLPEIGSSDPSFRHQFPDKCVSNY